MSQAITGKTVWYVISQAIPEDARCRNSNNYNSSNRLKPGTVTGETKKIQLIEKCICMTHSIVVTKINEPPQPGNSSHMFSNSRMNTYMANYFHHENNSYHKTAQCRMQLTSLTV